MREILFRGKDPETGKWYEGFYMALSETTYCFKGDYDRHPDNTKHYIVFDSMTDWGLPNQHLRADADPSTVGQYTGLTDKNGKRIFEGDVVKTSDVTHEDVIQIPGELFAIELRKGCWTMVCGQNWDFLETNYRYVEVIGNIHDNPELLKGGEG